MAMQLDNVVPFGRSFEEYCHMFNLSEQDLGQKIIGVGDGPASFNAEMTALRKSVLSVDPLYVFNASAIEQQFYRVVDNIIAQVKQTPSDWVWQYHRSADALKSNRIKALQTFIADYQQGKNETRYQVGELPTLNIQDDAFDIALCSHFLFLYSAQFDYVFHQAAVFEMLRIAKSVRIFPLMTLALKKSPHVAPLMDELQARGYTATITRVDYELQRGGNEMLKITQ